ncbi:hypothetical protein PIB30_056906 [Stylosanthes scabra]|uniref:Uncharacterized protein n=1 Tax=Stylosanthes scabra TaxID=79078 RepID=A0ABU6YLY1_9FABA|nr:hypothetical protein [Stylosanthes scabra]
MQGVSKSNLFVTSERPLGSCSTGKEPFMRFLELVLNFLEEGLFASRSTAKASKRADFGDKVLERRGVDLQGHSDVQVSKV